MRFIGRLILDFPGNHTEESTDRGRGDLPWAFRQVAVSRVPDPLNNYRLLVIVYIAMYIEWPSKYLDNAGWCLVGHGGLFPSPLPLPKQAWGEGDMSFLA